MIKREAFSGSRVVTVSETPSGAYAVTARQGKRIVERRFKNENIAIAAYDAVVASLAMGTINGVSREMDKAVQRYQAAMFSREMSRIHLSFEEDD